MSPSETTAATLAPVEEPSLLDAGTFVTRFAPASPFNRSVHALRQLLVTLPRDGTLAEQADWLEELSSWLHSRHPVLGDSSREPRPTLRLRFLYGVLSELPEQVDSLRALTRNVLQHAQAVRLFTDTGLPSEHGFFSEGLDRLSKALLPEAPQPEDMAQLVYRLFPSSRVASWFEQLPADLVAQGFELFWGPPAEGQQSLAEVVVPAMRQAMTLLAARACALGLADSVRARLPEFSLEQLPFLRLPHAVEAFLQGSSTDGKSPDMLCREVIAECRRAVHSVVEHLEESGVSIKLLFQLELITKGLDRLYMLLSQLAHGGGSGAAAAGAGLRLFTTLVRGGIRDRSLSDLWHTNVRILAREVIERNGHGGEHYITTDAREYHRMVDSAAGGGALTAFTALLKFVVTWAALPVFFEAFSLSLNYSLSFVIMQLCGFTLATKQPAMTAAALAGSIQETANAEEPDLEGLVEQIARMVRSQLAAIGGNLGMVIPTVVCVDLALRGVRGRGLLDAHAAQYVVHSLDPLQSGTLFYAALTGFLLWFASLFAGGLENWVVYRRLPEAIAAHRWMRHTLGPERARALADFILRHVGGVGGSVALGILLGSMPVMGKIFGVPLDVRHITLSTGSLVFAGMTHGVQGVATTEFLRAVVGIVCVGALNLGVSFGLALAVALRARGVGGRMHVKLAKKLFHAFRRAPGAFFLPPRNP